MKLTVLPATALAVLVAAPLAAADPAPASVGAARAAAAAPGAVAKAHHRKRRAPRCHVPRGSDWVLIKKTKRVLVFKHDTSPGDTWYCARPNGRKILMGTPASEQEEFVGYPVDHVRVAGAFVAYRSAVRIDGIVQSATFNLVGPRGNVVTGLRVGTDDGILFPTADGGLVWLVGSGDTAQLRATGGPYGDPGPPPPLAPETRGQLLDTGAIDPASVQVAGNTVTWVSAGVAKTFTPGA
jgi:hypothetical protein